MNEWYNKNMETLIKHNISEEVITYVANNENIKSLRKDVKEFLKNMHNKGVTTIIISAGGGNVIEKLLIRKGCYFDNIHITSNFMRYKNGIICGVKDNNLIHSLNKYII